jgi:antitoxin ParD1/3/4
MPIQLTPDQEQFIQTKIQTGQYQTAEEIVAAALLLLEEYDRADGSTAEIERVTRQADQARLDHYRQTGEGVEHAKVAAWLTSIGTDHELPCPTKQFGR